MYTYIDTHSDLTQILSHLLILSYIIAFALAICLVTIQEKISLMIFLYTLNDL